MAGRGGRFPGKSGKSSRVGFISEQVGQQRLPGGMQMCQLACQIGGIERMAQIERSIIEQALERNSGNVSRTAKLLNLQRTTLIEKINKYELRSV